MKQVSAALAAHLAGPVTTLTTCWSILRWDGAEFLFTDHDGDVAFDGKIYRASVGYSRTAISSDAQLAVDNLDIDGFLDDASITEEDMRAGLFDFAEVRIFLVNWQAPGMGALRLRRGRLGEVTLTGNGMFRGELRGLTQALQQEIGELYSAECRADLGDARCQVPLLPPVIERSTSYAVGDVVRAPLQSGTWSYGTMSFRCTAAGITAASQPVYAEGAGTSTTDGTATFVAEPAWTRKGQVDAVTARVSFTGTVEGAAVASGWFTAGVLTWITGPNAGRSVEIKSWASAGGAFELFIPVAYPISPGDQFTVAPGCDKRFATCKSRFANVLNFRGEPLVPGVDSTMSYPDAV
ncbi:DUF2163 domain-containing protein [Paracoccus liaowanqingii]|uniref:DUF2163 domain-containing protein n=1 Tax=Paracoccus liaowanqingii TaxID=2560053 RepID=UPI00143DA5EE|nr:DUF2163 domain-containing protein [Paracoccus liaowanqingii]